MSRRRAFWLCALPALSTVLLASSGETPANPAGTSPKEAALEPGVPALFSWADCDGDGRLDIAAVSADGTLHLLQSVGEGRFEDVTERVGLAEVGNAALASWADYDGDGRLDLFVGARAGASRLFHNEGGTFVDMSAASGLASTGAVQSAQWFDHDGDGRPDLHVVTAETHELYRGLAGGFFERAELPLAGAGSLAGPGVVIGEPAGETSSAPGTSSDEPGSDESGSRGAGNRVVPYGTPVSPGLPSSGGPAPILIFPANCAASVKDQANPGNCMFASTTPTLGRLYPLSTNLFVAVGGDVGIGTTTPVAKLDVAGSVVLSAGAPHSLRIRNGATEVAELGVAFQALQYSIDAQANDAVLRNMAPGKSIHIQSGSGFAAVTIDGSNLVGIGTPTPGAKLDVAGTARITDTLTLNPSGDAALDVSTGSIYKGGALFIHTKGGSNNTALGQGALASVTTGYNNTASGRDALSSNTIGHWNTASGRQALEENTTGYDNTASGVIALNSNTTGNQNTASGVHALRDNTTGSRNVALGSRAGIHLTTGNDNIAIGNEDGVAGESATIRIGTEGTQTKTFMAGIRGITTDIANAIPVRIDSSGQLGTASSSRRFKKDIADMGEATERLLELRPVVFHYKQEQTLPNGGEVPFEYGLIAEEVAEIMPDLVIYDEEGLPFTVKYDLLSSMLLNELKKQNERCVEQDEAHALELEELQERVARLESAEAEIASLRIALQALLEDR